jgi:phosphodiesterase/alkaline phosphatase D-like protein
LALLILGADWAAAQIVITNVTTVNVTPSSFSIVAAVSPAITPSMTASVSVFADAGGVTNLAGQVGIEYYPLHTGDPTLTNAYDRLVDEAALRQQTMGLGLFDVRVSGCSPGTTYFYVVEVSNTNGQTTLSPPSGLLPSVTTAQETSFVLDSEQLVVTLNDSSPAGAIITLSNPNTPSVLAAVVGDGAGANQAFFSVNDFIAAAGGTNYLPAGNQQFTAHVLGLSQQGLSQTYSVAFSTSFSVGSATQEVLGGGSATTLAASAITASSAILNASVNPGGAPTTVYFQWGGTTSYGNLTASNVLTANLNTTQPVALGISGLLPGTTNHFQVVAVNSAGTNYGGDSTVVTPALPPVGITLTASGVTASNAILNASVNPNGATTTVYFQWGGTTNYGNVTASNTLAANLNTAQAAALGIGGLLPGTTNHFRVVAGNSAGTTYGSDLTVVTPTSPPVGITLAASGVVARRATLNASVNPNGAPTTVYFQWGATTNYGSVTASNTLAANLNTTQPVALGISGLLPGTTNHFQVVAGNSAGTSYGSDLTVVTPVLPPLATTTAASGLSATSATLNALIDPEGGPTTVYFEWGATTNYGNLTASNFLTTNLETTQPVAAGISGLLPGTTNHFQAVAVNGAGSNYGGDLTVVTPALPPVGITLAASGVTARRATLNALVNPNGGPTTVYFQWGGTANYGSATSSEVLSANLNTAQTVALGASGLLPGTTNHFRVAAGNSAGTNYGSDLTVVTPALPPLATTAAASGISATSATLNALIDPEGGPTTAYFQWGGTTNYGSVTASNTLAANLNTAQPVALGIGGLLPGSTNHFQAVAGNSAGTSYGSDLTVVTPALPPLATTAAASGISATSATLNALIDPEGGPTTVYFQWGGTTNYGSVTSSDVLSANLNTAQPVALSIGGLLPGTTNHFRVAAGNSAGTNYGSDLTVVTPALPPVGITLAASGVTASNAILNASVNPNGAPTTVYFQWGGTTNYGNVTASNTLAANLNTAQPVALGIGGLLPGTTNHFRVAAGNSAGTNYGSDLAVVTLASPPVATALAASGITASNATLNASINPNGALTSIYFQWGATTNYGSLSFGGTLASNLNAGQLVALAVHELLPGSVVHFQVLAVNDAGLGYSADQTFGTPALPPTVATLPASGVSATNATFNATVNPNGAAATVYFAWGQTTNYGSYTPTNILALNLNAAQPVAAAVGGLLPGTTNHFQAVAVNSAGASLGGDQSLVTPVLAPAAITLAASGVTASNATLNGTVNPNGSTATVYFQWGATTNYGSLAMANTLSGNLNSAQAVTLGISGLMPDTTNHFRVLAISSGGINYGADQAFLTALPAPAAGMLVAWLSAGGARELTLYGVPGHSYQIQSSTNLGNTSAWTNLALVPMTGLTYVLSNLDRRPAAIFYRAYDFAADPPVLQAYIGNPSRALLAFGLTGTNYQLQYSTNISSAAFWQPLVNYTLTNSFQFFTNIGNSNPVIFYRVQRF